MKIKNLVTLSGILSWCNLIVSGLLALIALLSGMAVAGILNALTVVVLFGSITLHSYAALQLRKSLLNPGIPLAGNTSTGLRFVGYFVLFFAIFEASMATVLLRSPKELVQQMQAQLPPEYKNVNIAGSMHAAGVLMLIFCLSVLVNVLLNARLLRWYKMMQKRDES